VGWDRGLEMGVFFGGAMAVERGGGGRCEGSVWVDSDS